MLDGSWNYHVVANFLVVLQFSVTVIKEGHAGGKGGVVNLEVVTHRVGACELHLDAMDQVVGLGKA